MIKVVQIEFKDFHISKKYLLPDSFLEKIFRRYEKSVLIEDLVCVMPQDK